MIIQAYKCTETGKLFEDKEKYKKHLRALATQRAQQRRLAKAEAEREAFIANIGATVKSIDELKKFIHDNWEWFFANGLKHRPWACDKKPVNKHKLVNLNIDVRWSDTVSNTHHCPRGGVRNWDQRGNREKGPNLPESYPGWHGCITFEIDAGMSSHKKNPYKFDGYGGDYFSNTPIQTGGGVGGDRKYSYELYLFAADFPAMSEARERAMVWNTLTDKQELEFA